MARPLITDIADLIVVADPPDPADAIFLPGGAPAEQPEYAAALYRQGYGKWLIPSGGVSVKKERWPGVSSKADVYTGDYHTNCAVFIDVLRKNGVPASAIVNKSDLPTRMDVEAIQKRFEKTVSLSAATGEGLAALEQALSEILDTKDFHPQEGVLFTQRQRMDAQTASDSLREGEQALALGLTLDAVTVCVEDALHALAALTGEQVSEEIVDRVFEEFCVGK